MKKENLQFIIVLHIIFVNKIGKITHDLKFMCLAIRFRKKKRFHTKYRVHFSIIRA